MKSYAERGNLALKIIELRKERGWTQNELAKRSGIDRGAIASMETGKAKKPTTANLLKLAETFAIHPEELYVAAGYIKEARTTYNYNETPEQILERLKLDIRRLEKHLIAEDRGKGIEEAKVVKSEKPDNNTSH
jgi:transcriptional regulator with XRE-family HTH domain